MQDQLLLQQLPCMHQSQSEHFTVILNFPHLVSCFLLKRSLITGVPLNILPRCKDLILLPTAKGTHGMMFYNQNTLLSACSPHTAERESESAVK